MIFKKTKNQNSVAYEQIPLSNKIAFFIFLGIVIFLCLSAWGNSLISKIAMLLSVIFVGIIILIYCLYSLPLTKDYLIASIKGKKIAKSGNWWTGNLKYEIEK